MLNLEYLRKLCITVFAAILILMGSTSCVTHSDLTYMKSGQDKETYIMATLQPYKLREGDQLYIKVFGSEEKTFEFFNPENQGNGNVSRESLYFDGYTINGEGYIEMPVLGKINLAGLTIDQAKEVIQKKIDQYLKDSLVIVKLANFYITVLGEVGKPQQLDIYDDRTTIYDVLALTGDISATGNRRDIKIIRNVNDTLMTYHIDLTDRSILENELLFVRPRDLIYVEPTKATVLRSNRSEIAGTISLVVSIITLISVLSL